MIVETSTASLKFRARIALSIVGVEAAPVEDVLIRNVTVATAREPDRIAHTRDLRLDGVRENGKELRV